MGSEWRELPFTEAVQVNPKVSLKRGQVYPFVDMKAVDPSWRNASESEYRVFKNGGARFMPYDTLMARITPCLENGKIARYIPRINGSGPAFGSTEFIVIRGREGVTNNDFAYYLTKWQEFRQFAIAQMTGSSGRQRVPADSLAGFSVPVPELDEQHAIAHILGSLDDKIELNRQMNRTLEKMAQAIFKSWFIDFDPVRAKAEGRDPGLPKEIADLFPASFEDSKLGPIPKGWRVKPFGDLLERTIGGDWGKEHEDKKHTRKCVIIRGTDIPALKAGMRGKTPTRWVEEKKLKTRQLVDADIVIEISGGSPKQPTGRSLFITDRLLTRLGNIVEPASFCRLFRPKNSILGLLAAQHLTHIYGKGKMWEYQNQSTGISNFQTKTFLEKELITIPDNERLLEAFYVQCRPLIDASYSNESCYLAKLRDTLLPKLISGELHVPDAEKFIEETGV